VSRASPASMLFRAYNTTVCYFCTFMSRSSRRVMMTRAEGGLALACPLLFFFRRDNNHFTSSCVSRRKIVFACTMYITTRSVISIIRSERTEARPSSIKISYKRRELHVKCAVERRVLSVVIRGRYRNDACLHVPFLLG
jgi:hypothetical protein